MRKIFLILFLVPILVNAQTQIPDSVHILPVYPQTIEGNRFSAGQLVVPGVLIAAGIYGTINKQLDKKVRDQAIKWDGDTFIDGVLPAVAPASVYILNWSGVHGKHNFIDRTVIVGTTFILTTGTTYLLKKTIDTPRPDGDGNDAFPSMHTAVAFAGAEFLRQELKDKSVWYGIGGYTLAVATGFLRIYNNRHWFSDVLAGAGVGILSAQAAYWLYPEIRKLYVGSVLEHAMIIPFGNGQVVGIGFFARF